MNASRRSSFPKLPLAVLGTCLLASVAALTARADAPAPGSPGAREMSLEACLDAALQNNHRRPASRFAVAAAEAQHRQALSAYWPQVKLSAAYLHMDEAPTFVFPASMMGIPAQTVTTPAGTAYVTVPPGVLGPTAVQLPVSIPSQTITTQAQVFPVPEQRLKVADPESTIGSVDFTWLLYDGGLRAGLRSQADGLVEAMKQASRRTDLEITDSVTRLYYGAVLARQVLELGNDTLARLEMTLRLTETMYKNGGGKVTKADYLDNKVTVETLRSIVALLEKNAAMARAALANTMGLSWQADVAPQSTEIPFVPVTADLDALVGSAYEFSPDWKSLAAGLHAGDGAVQAARSGHAPKLALTGNLHKWWNSYDAGMANRENKEGWVAGIGLELPLFDGFLTRNKVAEARARLSQLKEQQFLLKEGLGLQIKDIFLGLEATRKAYQATLDAKAAAEENRDLNIRAYQNELVETEKVIRAQITEALMTAQHLKTRYDYVALQSQLALVVGREVTRQLSSAP